MKLSPFSTRYHQIILILALLLSPILGGCVVFPTSEVEGGFDKADELIQALIGASKIDVRSQLGDPDNTYELPEVTYLFYERGAKQDWYSLAYPITILWMQLPISWGTADVLHCLLIESRNDEVVHAEVKVSRDLTGAAMHMRPIYRSCPSLFWGGKELERIEMAAKNYRPMILIERAKQGDVEAAFSLAKEFQELRYLQELAAAGNVEAATALAGRFRENQPLYDLAEQGNVDAAVQLAETFGDRKPLKALVDRGNPEAVVAFRRITCQKIYFRADESRKPEANDNFVYMCEGDDLSTEETVLISADWDKTYTSPPRRYFTTVPKSLR